MTSTIDHQAKCMAQLLSLLADGSNNAKIYSPLTSFELLKEIRGRNTRSEVDILIFNTSINDSRLSSNIACFFIYKDKSD